MEKQKTIAKEISFEGRGLHTGKAVKIKLKPAQPDTGIVFIRTDLPGCPSIKATTENILQGGRSPRRTSIGNKDTLVHTIEHMMAAFCGLGIDNVYVEIDSDEVPGLDGSSANFLDLILQAQLKEQDKERSFYIVKEPLFVEEDNSSIIVLPSSELKISYTLDYQHSWLKPQFLQISLNQETFKKDIASARTFCLEEEAAELQRQGFGRGANYENTLVVGNKGVIKNKLRYEDEFIRHKMLDLIGDLYLLGSPLKAHVVALRSGHGLNTKLVSKITQQMHRYQAAGIGSGYCPKDSEELDIEAIMKILPHRHPFLLVDRIVRLDKGKKVIGIKNVTINDYYFQGHFPGRPVMPGVLIVEAMAQVGGIMMLSCEENKGKIAFFMSIDRVKFRKTVVPGDQLVLEVEAGKLKSKTGKVFGKAYVDGKLAAEAELMFILAD